MLPKQRRIQRKFFSEILSKGARFNTEHFLVYILQTEKENPSRFSFSISKKVAQKAVTRNLYRRRGYAIISKYLEDITTGYNLFFVYKKGSLPVSFVDLESEIILLLKKSHLI
ncbi:MAG: ribonuclease P protein component [bacterium]